MNTYSNPIGVLALQGDFSAHIEALGKIYDREAIEVRTLKDLEKISSLVIPGGESSTLLKLLYEDFKKKIISLVKNGMPIFGTCAGAILISKKVLNPEQESLSLIDVTIERNSYGRQTNSFIEEKLSLSKSFENTEGVSTEGVFIRAPKVIKWGNDVSPLLFYKDSPVLLKKDNILLATFHPELTTKKHFAYLNFLSLI